MNWHVLVSQGRVADRSARLLKGAMQLAQMYAQLGYSTQRIGQYDPAQIQHDLWQASLTQAQAHLTEFRQCCKQVLQQGQPLLCIQNTCASSLATLPMALKHYPNLKVLWLDAHADFNTPKTTQSGHLSGMVLAGIAGLWQANTRYILPTAQLMLVGVREIDVLEQQLLDQHAIRRMSGLEFNLQQVLDFVQDDPVWIHLDWDVLDAGLLPEYDVVDGLSPLQLRTLFSQLNPAQIKGLALAEYYAVPCAEQTAQHLNLMQYILQPLLSNQNKAQHQVTNTQP